MQILYWLAKDNKRIEELVISYCSQIGDVGVTAATRRQTNLVKLELRGLERLTSAGLAHIKSTSLTTVDLSDCPLITSSGILQLLYRNPYIEKLYLNNCSGLDDSVLYGLSNGRMKYLKVNNV